MVANLLNVVEAGRALGVSRATVWRWIQAGELPSVRRGGRRLVPAAALRRKAYRGAKDSPSPFRRDHPMFRLMGAGRGGGVKPGARDKHAVEE